MTGLKQALRGRLTGLELGRLRASFDVVGDIAVIEVPFELEKKEQLIASSLLKLLKNVNVVVKKVGGHVGKFRLQKMEVLAGEDRLVTVHKESGCVFRLDVGKCYFSPRLSHERLRAASLILPSESVFVACSGVAPFPIIMSKHSNAKRIVGLELNPAAHKFALENVLLNRCRNVEVFKGDVKMSSRFVKGPFDRIFLPAPKEGSALVAGVLPVARKSGCFLHVYDFAPEGFFEEAGKRVKEACNKEGFSCKILKTVRCGQHAPRVFRVCVACFVKKRY